MRWSPTCRTNWTRVTSYIGTTGLYARVEREGGPDGGYLCYDNPNLGCQPSDIFSQINPTFTPQFYAPNNNARAKGWITQGGNTYYNCVAQPGWGC